VAITKDCPTPDQAFQVIEFLTSADGQMPIVEMKQDAPANAEVLRSDKFLNTDWAGNYKINLQALIDSVDMAFPLPLTPQWNEMLTILGDNLAEFFLDTKDAQSSLDAAQQQLEELFNQ